jgi:DNA-3-methyladenine glycosylase
MIFKDVLPIEFYKRDTIEVARDLIGKILVHKARKKIFAGRIVETEAYLGVEDKACHTFGHRKTERTQVMYQDGGHAYVYLIYGLHHCFNVVTETEGVPEAVLIRALEPLEGFGDSPDCRLLAGPGKLCRGMGIDRSHNGIRLDSGNLFLTSAYSKIKETTIVAAERVGVDYAEDATFWPLRFYLDGHLSVSQF